MDMNNSIQRAQTMNIIDLINLDGICIPYYQRPYKWTIKNIGELLSDISIAINESKKYVGQDYRYRIGTILLHRNEEKGVYEIVDGQQRILSVLLIYKYLGEDTPLLNTSITNKTTQCNLYHNYKFIEQWFAIKDNDEKVEFKAKLKEIIEVVVIAVYKETEAFQLFDSQNSRGKPLYPHDLLKAYHLREMSSLQSEMKHAVEKWEAKNPVEIRNLFYDYLFPIYNWAKGITGERFSDRHIDCYKGAAISDSYTYAIRAFKASPCFQISEPFIAGGDFFKFVDYYIELLNDLRSELENSDIKIIKQIVGANDSIHRYCKILFLCALMCYYDRFHRFDKMAVIRLFSWAYMIRVDMSSLGYDTIKKYAVGDSNTPYTNQIAMFSTIVNARRHTDISNLTIRLKQKADITGLQIDKRRKLLDALQKLNGLNDDQQ